MVPGVQAALRHPEYLADRGPQHYLRHPLGPVVRPDLVVLLVQLLRLLLLYLDFLHYQLVQLIRGYH